jgi:hypothetical protein
MRQPLTPEEINPNNPKHLGPMLNLYATPWILESNKNNPDGCTGWAAIYNNPDHRTEYRIGGANKVEYEWFVVRVGDNVRGHDVPIPCKDMIHAQEIAKAMGGVLT